MREDAVAPRGMAERKEQHGDRIGEGRGHARERILGPRPILHGEHPGRAAILHPAIAVRYSSSHPLLSADDGPYPHPGRRFDEGRGRVCT